MGLFLSRILSYFVAEKRARVCMLGLDAAGKTTILYKMKLDELITTIPTVGFNVEQITYQNLTMTVWDVGGQKTIRNLWKHYLANNDAVIFVVDSSDRERMEEAREELWALLELDETDRDTALLVLANKQDLPSAASAAELTDRLGLYKLRDGRKWYVQSTVATSGEGLWDGLSWLAKTIKAK